MMWNTFTVNKLRPFSVGFDDFFNFAESFNQELVDKFPKYNIIKDDDNYVIEMALAGYSKDDLDITCENGVLTISHNKQSEADQGTFVHRGISKRAFTKSFTLADTIVVKGASFVDGLLTVKLEQIVPEEKKLRRINISDTIPTVATTTSTKKTIKN